jgi:hypothetical protein
VTQDYDCCALCGMFSCDCGPGAPCRQPQKEQAGPIDPRDYGRSILVQLPVSEVDKGILQLAGEFKRKLDEYILRVMGVKRGP